MTKYGKSKKQTEVSPKPRPQTHESRKQGTPELSRTARESIKLKAINKDLRCQTDHTERQPGFLTAH